MCRVLSEEGITSIENWTDIVPEAREATIAGHLSELKEAIETLQNEKAELMDKLESAAGAEAEAGALKSEIAAKNLRITTLENAYRSVATKALYELANNSAAPTHRNALADLMPPPGPKKKVGNIGTWYYAKDTPAPRRPSPTERNPSKPEES
jgi:chromosome segregation ATPase